MRQRRCGLSVSECPALANDRCDLTSTRASCRGWSNRSAMLAGMNEDRSIDGVVARSCPARSDPHLSIDVRVGFVSRRLESAPSRATCDQSCVVRRPTDDRRQLLATTERRSEAVVATNSTIEPATWSVVVVSDGAVNHTHARSLSVTVPLSFRVGLLRPCWPIDSVRATVHVHARAAEELPYSIDVLFQNHWLSMDMRAIVVFVHVAMSA
jgi:hypothetical protein